MQETKQAEKPKMSINDVLEQYVKNKNGAIFQVLGDKKNPLKCYLRSRNKYISMPLRTIQQGLIDREWFPINKHELRAWMKEDNAYIEKLTQKLVKRIILGQLLLEIDDDLLADAENTPNLRNHLLKSNKALERIVEKNYDRLYGVDKQILQNLMNEVDELTSKMAGLEITDFIHINRLMDKYKLDPKKYQEKEILFTKIED